MNSEVIAVQLASILLIGCGHPAAVPTATHGNDGGDAYLKALVQQMDAVPVPTELTATRSCPMARRGKLYAIDYDLMLDLSGPPRHRRRVFMPALATESALVSVVDSPPPRTGRTLLSMFGNPDYHPAFARVGELTFKVHDATGAIDAHVTGAVYVIDSSGAVSCQEAFALTLAAAGPNAMNEARDALEKGYAREVEHILAEFQK